MSAIAQEASVIFVSATSPPPSITSLMQSRRWSSSKERATRSRALVTAEIWVRASRAAGVLLHHALQSPNLAFGAPQSVVARMLLGNVTNFPVSHFDSILYQAVPAHCG
jgi:hypothetical protein